MVNEIKNNVMPDSCVIITSKGAGQKVEVGQVWKDKHSRSSARIRRLMVKEIEGSKARCEDMATLRKTNINIATLLRCFALETDGVCKPEQAMQTVKAIEPVLAMAA